MNIKKLFISLIEYFKLNNIEYYIIRNYEGYPNEFTGDIDLYVDLKKVMCNLNEIERIIGKYNWIIFRSLKRDWILSYQLICKDENENRRIIVIEMFNLFYWIEFEYLPISILRRYKENFNKLSIFPDSIGYFLTFCHYFYWAGFLPEKYNKKIKRSFNNKEVIKLANIIWPSLIKNQLYKELALYFSNNFYIKKDYIPEKIFVFSKKLLIMSKLYLLYRNFITEPIIFVLKITKLLKFLFCEFINPRGNIIYYSGTKEQAKQLLFFFKKYHLFKNKGSKVISIESNNIFFNILISVKLYLQIFRGSIIIIPNMKKNTKNFFYILFKNRVLFIDQNSNSESEQYNIISQLIKQ